jgi:hypothetical protein
MIDPNQKGFFAQLMRATPNLEIRVSLISEADFKRVHKQLKKYYS